VTTAQWLGVAGFLLLFGILAFALRQGMKVEPSGRDPNKSNIGE